MKVIAALLGFVVAGSVWAGGQPSAPGDGTDAPPPLPTAEMLHDLLSAFDVPGIAVAGIRACAVEAEVVTAGLAIVEDAVPVTPDTAFEAASLSKSVFAWLVMSLAEEGTIDLDAPLAGTFDYPRIEDKAAYARITPRMVLVHRTGLPNWVDVTTPFFERTAPIPFDAAPGEAWTYSGEAYQLLQLYVEEKTGRTLQRLFEERLGDVMPNSTFVLPIPDSAAPSRGYRTASDPATGRDYFAVTERGQAASSLLTTAKDYAQFLSLVCRRERLEPETYEAMLTPQSPVPEDESDLPTNWALGFMTVTLDPHQTFVGHGGNNDEYRALAGFIRERGDGIVILTNGMNGEAVIDAITRPPASPAGSGAPLPR